MKLQSGLISQSLQFDLPQSRAVAVTAAAIGRDEQLRRLWESARAHFAPPLQDAGDSELGRVVVDPHAHPAFIGGDVVDTVRNCLAQLGIREVMDRDFFRLPLGLPLLASILEVSHEFLLLGVNRNDWLSPPLKSFHFRTDELELGVAIGMLLAFPGLAVGLQAVVRLAEQSRDGARAYRVILLLQFVGKFSRALARPPQRTFWVTTSQRVNQRVECLFQGRIKLGEAFPSSTGSSQSSGDRRSGINRPLCQLTLTGGDSIARKTSGGSYTTNATLTKRVRFRCRPLTAHALVHDREQCLELASNPFDFNGILHTLRMPDSWKRNNCNLLILFLRGSIACRLMWSVRVTASLAGITSGA